MKVLDFGLAKVADPNDEPASSDLATEMHTREGAIMGTMPYMSPEQIEGREVDPRSDIFSLGVVLHEMATGKRPFHGPTTPALLSAILRDPPPELSSVRPDFPEGLNQLVSRCLEKNSRLRIQTAKEIRQELEALHRKLNSKDAARKSADSIPGFGGRPAIAVLPFENLSRDPEQEYFADGLAEDLITRLSLWRSFPVIARNSSFVYKGKAVDVKQVASDLRVRYIVESASGYIIEVYREPEYDPWFFSVEVRGVGLHFFPRMCRKKPRVRQCFRRLV